MLGPMSGPLDHERCYRAVAGRDARFDGWFFTAVRTTGIYCRPSCPARTPLARNVSFFTTAAGGPGGRLSAPAGAAAPTPCPGSPEWDVRADVVARAMRLIADGEVERSGVPGSGRAARLLRAAAAPAAGRRARRRAARARPRPARPDRPAADRDHRPADGRRRLRGRVRQHPAVQRHRARGLRDDAHPACAAHARAPEHRQPRLAHPPAGRPRPVRRRRGAALPRRPRRPRPRGVGRDDVLPRARPAARPGRRAALPRPGRRRRRSSPGCG